MPTDVATLGSGGSYDARKRRPLKLQGLRINFFIWASRRGLGATLPSVANTHSRANAWKRRLLPPRRRAFRSNVFGPSVSVGGESSFAPTARYATTTHNSFLAKNISTSIPLARPSQPIATFAAKEPIPSPHHLFAPRIPAHGISPAVRGCFPSGYR